MFAIILYIFRRLFFAIYILYPSFIIFFLCDYAVTCFVSKAHAQHTHRYSHVHTLHSKFIYMLSTMFSVFIPLDRPKSGQNRTIASCVYVCASLFTGIKIFCIHTDILTSLGWCCSFVLKQVHTVCNV